jgi:hypothetical protein
MGGGVGASDSGIGVYLLCFLLGVLKGLGLDDGTNEALSGLVADFLVGGLQELLAKQVSVEQEGKQIAFTPSADGDDKAEAESQLKLGLVIVLVAEIAATLD